MRRNNPNLHAFASVVLCFALFCACAEPAAVPVASAVPSASFTPSQPPAKAPHTFVNQVDGAEPVPLKYQLPTAEEAAYRAGVVSVISCENNPSSPLLLYADKIGSIRLVCVYAKVDTYSLSGNLVLSLIIQDSDAEFAHFRLNGCTVNGYTQSSYLNYEESSEPGVPVSGSISFNLSALAVCGITTVNTVKLTFSVADVPEDVILELRCKKDLSSAYEAIGLTETVNTANDRASQPTLFSANGVTGYLASVRRDDEGGVSVFVRILNGAAVPVRMIVQSLGVNGVEIDNIDRRSSNSIDPGCSMVHVLEVDADVLLRRLIQDITKVRIQYLMQPANTEESGTDSLIYAGGTEIVLKKAVQQQVPAGTAIFEKNGICMEAISLERFERWGDEGSRLQIRVRNDSAYPVQLFVDDASADGVQVSEYANYSNFICRYLHNDGTILYFDIEIMDKAVGQPYGYLPEAVTAQVLVLPYYDSNVPLVDQTCGLFDASAGGGLS